MEILPTIDIAVHGDPKIFVNEMTQLATAEYEVEAWSGLLSDPVLVWNFIPRVPQVHTELYFQLICTSQSVRRVSVEVRASDWDGEVGTPTKEAYCHAAGLTVGKLLSSYNRAFGKRYRLRFSIPTYGPPPSKRTIERLEKFTRLANVVSLHPLDWVRFYGFVHQCRQDLSEETLIALLIERGFPPQSAKEVASVYEHLANYKSMSRR